MFIIDEFQLILDEYYAHAKTGHNTNGGKDSPQGKIIFFQEPALAQASKTGPISNICQNSGLSGRIQQDNL
jgi:hypothetical protein